MTWAPARAATAEAHAVQAGPIGQSEGPAQRRPQLHARANLDVQLVDPAELARQSGADLVRIMRLDPALEELRRDRDMRNGVLDPDEFEAREPGAVDGLTEFGAQAPAGASP